ncbi:MAG: AbrB/MazE/SpoVT family DNA-binding domain-containing protein [Pleurocapsa sp. SU_196_0]|nr:AbrB/MazE/SpoVT family DNA-binding domain-containing protein [Pleurocapsa sp. SU_196_0]
MIRKLQKVGKSRALIISKELAGLIGLGEDEEVQIEVYGNELKIRAASAPERVSENYPRWLQTPEMQARIEAGLRWATQHPQATSDIDALEAQLTKKRRTHS